MNNIWTCRIPSLKKLIKIDQPVNFVELISHRWSSNRSMGIKGLTLTGLAARLLSSLMDKTIILDYFTVMASQPVYRTRCSMFLQSFTSLRSFQTQPVRSSCQRTIRDCYTSNCRIHPVSCSRIDKYFVECQGYMVDKHAALLRRSIRTAAILRMFHYTGDDE